MSLVERERGRAPRLFLGLFAAGGALTIRINSYDPVVITGVGLITSVGHDRESSWKAVRTGASGVRRVEGVYGFPDDVALGAVVDLPPSRPRRMKSLDMLQVAAAEAIRDSRVNLDKIDRDQFGCWISTHMGDTSFCEDKTGRGRERTADSIPWIEQFTPNSGCVEVANRYGLNGPRMCHAAACASGMIDFISAVRALHDEQCERALVGASECLHPLMLAGFQQMKVLATHDDPAQACRPFDSGRQGFVMGEGAAVFMIERLSAAQARGARIYAEVLAGRMLNEAHHVTNLDQESHCLTRAIVDTLRKADLAPDDVGYINVHGTGTQQNDLCEAVGIRKAFGRAADRIPVSATKSMLGHLLNAAGAAELAITVLALRDGFVPPTLNLTDPDPACKLDHLPLVGRSAQAQIALKLSVAFGGHIAAVALRRWNDAHSGFGYPGRIAA